MGCFLQCFGLSKKRKRRKTLYKVLATAEQKHGNYVPLDSSVTANLGIPEKAIVPYSGFRECKEKTECKLKTGSVKTRKKVSFNLNVQIYEPNAYHILDSNDEEENEKDNGESKGKSSSSSILEEESEDFTMKYPSNYRYYNCRDIYDEEDEIAYEESNDDDGFDDDDEEWDDDYSLVNGNHGEDKICVENSRERGSSLSGQDRSQNIHSVLCPVENLSQWKAIKAKVAPSKQRRKENIPLENSEPSLINLSPFRSEPNVLLQSKPLLPEIAVDLSLSNWLISPNSNGSATSIHCH